MKPSPVFFKILARLALIGILGLTSCNLPMMSTSNDQDQMITQTFAAVNTSLAGTQSAALAELNQTPPPDEAETTTPETQTPEPTATIEHKMIPGEPPGGMYSSVTDADSSRYAAEKRAGAGEFFDINMYERPFTANEMEYYPDLDIQKTVLYRTNDWIFANIFLKSPGPEGDMRGSYGLEIDLDKNGRGDVLIMAGQPGGAWSTDRVRVWLDSNFDVGNRLPVNADYPQTSDGYDNLIFDAGVGNDADLAWARRAPNDNNLVQIAFKPALINNKGEWMWGAWTDLGVMDATWMDYNDHFTHVDAGSPLSYLTQYYPLKALALVDNTCRWSAGFNPIGNEPGLCPLAATPTLTPPPNTPVPTPQPSSITGIVFRDGNSDLIYQAGELPIAGATVRLYGGSCGSGGGEITSTSTGGDGRYVFNGILPGDYCVDVVPVPASFTVKTDATSISVGVPKTHIVDFGYFYLG